MWPMRFKGVPEMKRLPICPLCKKGLAIRQSTGGSHTTPMETWMCGIFTCTWSGAEPLWEEVTGDVQWIV